MSKDLMHTVLQEYVSARPNADTALLSEFCAFVGDWFVKSNIIGVGMTPEGISLRLGDGTETRFSVTATVGAGVTDAIPVTGTTTIVAATPVSFPSKLA